MVTWNVSTAEPPADVRTLLHLDSQPATDLYVIGWVIVNHMITFILKKGCQF